MLLTLRLLTADKNQPIHPSRAAWSQSQAVKCAMEGYITIIQNIITHPSCPKGLTVLGECGYECTLSQKIIISCIYTHKYT